MVEPSGTVKVHPPARWLEREQKPKAPRDRWAAVRDHIVILDEALFGHVVNSNLEVRTSVAIDPFRGAAEDKNLFTYEAIPRATFLTCEVTLDDFRASEKARPFPFRVPQGGAAPAKTWKNPLDVVRTGFEMIAWLGVGGMGTRGFGRLTVVGEPLEDRWGEEEEA